MPDLSGYSWDKGAGIYRTPGGEPVPLASVHDALAKAAERAAERMGEVSGRLQAGTATVDEWHKVMAESMKTTHTAATALANGGWRHTSQAAWGRAGNTLKGQYTYLRDFASQLANGEQPMDGRFMARASMYASGAHGSYENERRAERVDAGMVWERRYLSAVENCDGCLAQADIGWAPVGTLDEIGDEECLTNCRCFFEYADSTDMPEND